MARSFISKMGKLYTHAINTAVKTISHAYIGAHSNMAKTHECNQIINDKKQVSGEMTEFTYISIFHLYSVRNMRSHTMYYMEMQIYIIKPYRKTRGDKHNVLDWWLSLK